MQVAEPTVNLDQATRGFLLSALRWRIHLSKSAASRSIYLGCVFATALPAPGTPERGAKPARRGSDAINAKERCEANGTGRRQRGRPASGPGAGARRVG